MNPITHVLTGWCLAETLPRITRRERILITMASVVSDLDGFGIVAEWTTRESERPLLWWTEYHHVLGHNLVFAVVTAVVAITLAHKERALTATYVFIGVHLHIVGDVMGSRGPDDYHWPIPYLYPFSMYPQLTWGRQWHLNAWPNVAFTAALLVVTIVMAWRRGYSLIGLASPSADQAFVGALRSRFGSPKERRLTN
jgi:membrane-bound metal-dependent hydrolase YbcI (DUF457 family)